MIRATLILLTLASCVPVAKNPEPAAARVSVSRKVMTIDRSGRKVAEFPIQVSRYGIGGSPGSRKTPLGKHRVIGKFGDGAPLRQNFAARRPVRYRTGITTRILWIAGPELPSSRFIYLHGSNHTSGSNGCVHLSPEDAVKAFDLLIEGSAVKIER